MDSGKGCEMICRKSFFDVWLWVSLFRVIYDGGTEIFEDLIVFLLALGCPFFLELTRTQDY